MRALIYEGPGLIRVADQPEPEIVEATDALVRTTKAGLCGSDLHPYLGREAMAPGTIPGHEAVGVVEAVGADVVGIEPGDRVIVPFTSSCGRCEACRRDLSARCEVGALFGWRDPADPSVGLDGCQAELVRVPHADGTLIPASQLSDVAALLLADNLPTGFAAVERAGAKESLTVVGLGAVGLCAVAVARKLGVDRVVAIDPVPERVERAVGLGAVAGDPDRPERTTAVVEAAGSVIAQRTAFDHAAPGSVVSVISVQTGAEHAFTPIEAYDRNLTVAWGRAPVRSVLDRHFDLLAAVAGDIADEIVDSPHVALNEGPAAYAAFAERAFVKAALDPVR